MGMVGLNLLQWTVVENCVQILYLLHSSGVFVVGFS